MESKSLAVNLSTILNQTKQYHGLMQKATLWFNALFSLIEEHQDKDMRDDINLEQKIQLMKILNFAVASVANFYQQQRPNGIFKMFNFGNHILDLMESSKDYSVIITKVNYLNTLASYAIKTKQYSFAIDIFNEILEIYNSKIIDSVNEFFVSFFNNYLIFLRRSSKKMTSTLLQVQSLFKDLFIRFLAKLISYDLTSNIQNHVNATILLVAIYQQNKTILSKHEKDVNTLAGHSYQMHLNIKKRLPDNMIEFLIRQRINKQIYFKMQLKLDEIKFYSSNKLKNLHRGSHGPAQSQKERPENKLNKIQTMLEQSIQLLNEQKITSARLSSLRYSSQLKNTSDNFQTLQLDKTIHFDTKNIVTLQPLPIPAAITHLNQSPLKTNRPALKRVPTKTVKPAIAKKIKLKNTIFKIRQIFIEVNEDGILLSDYTKQNKRYIEWNTLSMILDRIQLQFPIEEFLKVSLENYYDFTRILSCYLTKNDNRQICLQEKPLPLLQINQLLNLYKQEGKYFKLALMNHYDTTRFVGIVDFYISQFDEFFKNLNENEYMSWLNEKLEKKNVGVFQKDENTYLIDYLKRKRLTTVEQLRNQLNIEHLQYAIQERKTLYKCIFLLKNNLQLYLKIIDNIPQDQPLLSSFLIHFKIQNVLEIGNDNFHLQSQKHDEQKKINKLVQVPLQKITKYFPLYSMTIREYLNCYARMFADILNRFEIHADQINLADLSFQIIIYASRTQTIEYGKFFSIVSAEVVGSKQRVWAVIIRFYDLAYAQEKITVLMNPYAEFLQGFLSNNTEEKQQILRNLLINGSVKDSYNWLKSTGKTQKRLNIFEYLYGSSLI